MSIERTPPQTRCPADVLGFIPWYPDGLDDAQRGAVEAHAAGCSACREEIAMLQGLSEPGAAPDPERIYAQVLARMETAAPEVLRGEHDQADDTPGASVSRLPLREQDGETEAHAPVLGRPVPAPASWRRIASTPSVRRVALAASLLLALAVGALVGPDVLTRDAPEPVYEKASESPPAAAAGGSSLEVVFREDANASQINQTLRALGARITSGPSQLGVYRLELGADVDLTAAKKLLTEDRDGVATFAEKPLRP